MTFSHIKWTFIAIQVLNLMTDLTWNKTSWVLFLFDLNWKNNGAGRGDVESVIYKDNASTQLDVLL